MAEKGMGGGGEDCDPWALECVRVRPNASGHEFAGLLNAASITTAKFHVRQSDCSGLFCKLRLRYEIEIALL